MDVFLVLFGVQVIRDDMLSPLIPFPWVSGTAVHILLRTWYLFSSGETLLLSLFCGHWPDYREMS